MTDAELLALFVQRDERAVAETQAKYGRLCRQVAYGILANQQDAEEITNDVLMRAWDVLPQEQPKNLGAFLAVMTRNLSTNRLDQYTAQRRGGGARPAVLDELAECTASAENVEHTVDARMLDDVLRQFLDALPAEQRTVFVLRYYYALPLPEIAARKQIGVSKVKVMLMRLRKRLNEHLKKEGFL